jgi:uroporphyrinogen decarboxylase
MSSRDLFFNAVRGRPVDRTPFVEEEIREEVLDRWYEEGLSRSVTTSNYREFFGLDRYEYIYMMYQPAKGTLRSPEDFSLVEDWYRGRKQEFCQPQYWRDHAEKLAGRDFPLGVGAWRGFMLPLFTHEQEWESLIDVLVALHDFPDQVKRVLVVVADWYIETLSLAFRYLEFDFVVISEPIASPSGTIISPSMFRDFLLPYYRKILSFLRDRGIWPVVFRSSSNVGLILPLVVETGVDGLWLNQTGGVIDYRQIRREYPDLLLIGGIDSTVLAGEPEGIEAEVRSKVPELLAGGRYLPSLDDNPRENVPYANYAHFRRLMAEVCATA